MDVQNVHRSPDGLLGLRRGPLRSPPFRIPFRPVTHRGGCRRVAPSGMGADRLPCRARSGLRPATRGGAASATLRGLFAPLRPCDAGKKSIAAGRPGFRWSALRGASGRPNQQREGRGNVPRSGDCGRPL